MAPGRNSYRIRPAVFDARERRLTAEKRLPKAVAWTCAILVGCALWYFIMRIFLITLGGA
jgi:hypothetical protein